MWKFRYTNFDCLVEFSDWQSGQPDNLNDNQDCMVKFLNLIVMHSNLPTNVITCIFCMREKHHLF